MLLTELLSPDRVVVPLSVGDRHAAIAALTRKLADLANAEYDEVLAAVLERESVLSTGIGFGVAIPHARCAAVQELTMVAGVTPAPVPFDAIDGEPVRLVFPHRGAGGVGRPARQDPESHRPPGPPGHGAPATARGHHR